MLPARILLLLIALFVASSAMGDECSSEVPYGIVEHYDAIVLAVQENTNSNWVHARVCFIRNRKLVATRYYEPSNFAFTLIDGQWTVVFRDHFWPPLDRCITADALIELRVEPDADEGEWFGMGRRMTDLETP